MEEELPPIVPPLFTVTAPVMDFEPLRMSVPALIINPVALVPVKLPSNTSVPVPALVMFQPICRP